MRSTRSLLLVALALVVLGVASFALHPVLDPSPESVCVAQGEPSSGFTDEDKELVLQRFGRSRRAGAKRTDSAGLGLAIVNSIALAHGGRVDIDSVPDLGSTVSLVIPRQPATEPA